MNYRLGLLVVLAWTSVPRTTAADDPAPTTQAPPTAQAAANPEPNGPSPIPDASTPDASTPNASTPNASTPNEPTAPASPPQATLPPAIPAAAVTNESPAPANTAAANTAPAADTAAANQAKSPLTAAIVQERMNQLAATQGLDETVRTDLTKRYQTALDWLAAARESEAKRAQYETDIEQAPARIDETKAQLGVAPQDQAIQPPPGATLTQLDQLRTQSEAELSTAKAELAQLEQELQKRTERKAELTRLIEEARQRAVEAEKQLAASPPAGETPDALLARRTECEARLVALSSQMEFLRAEGRRSDAWADLLPLARDLKKRKINQLERQVAAWQQLVSDQRRQEAEAQAREARRQVQRTIPALRQLAERNSTLADTRQRIAHSLTSSTQSVNQVQDQLEKLRDVFEQAREKVGIAGHSSTVGLMLRKSREKMPRIRLCQEQLRYIEKEMARINLERMEFDEQRAGLADLDTQVQHIVVSLTMAPATPFPISVEAMVRELLTTQRDLLDELTREYDRYLEVLSQLELNNRELIAEAMAFQDYIDEHVLWIRSAERLGVQDVGHATTAFAQLGQASPWLDGLRSARLDTLRRPVRGGLVAGVLLALFAFHTRLHRRLRALCSAKSGATVIKFRPTLDALAMAAFANLHVPLLLVFLGRRLTMSDQATELGYAIGMSLIYAAVAWWCSGFMRTICRADGIGETHFGWSSASVTVVRRELRWLTWIGIPLASVVVFAEQYQQGEWSSSLGRMAFIVAMVLLASFSHALLGGREHVARAHVAKDPAGWVDRVRRVLYCGGLGIPVLLAILAVVGYYYSAQQLSLRLQATLGLVMALVLVHALVSRWFLVKRRALSLQQARLRQQQQAEAAAESQENTNPLPTVNVDQQQDLADIHDRLRLLLRQAALIAFLVGGWFIWSDVLPALRILDRVEFWRTTVDVTETFEGPDGIAEVREYPQVRATTLRHALFALLVLCGTFLMGRNLPALLEITVLNRLPFDKGGRHAISVLTRYVVGLSGVLLACRLMNISWSSVQWLAAAITVGLGFGLQEVFANFVSGLILLFERPIRVGDIITLGDVTGAVTDIRIRATTVTNWDRKELIVPNKDLITGRLLNWTLSDTTNRLVVAVGVAYKSDPEQAREILLDTVRSHPNVLTDPEPSAVFDAFGESTLNFTVRCYLASLDVRLATVHDLHTTIHRRLREAGIEIAFPQRDINIRLADQALPIAVRPTSAAGRQLAERDVRSADAA